MRYSLFSMSEAEFGRTVDNYFDAQLDRYLEEEERRDAYERCKNCYNYDSSTKFCTLLIDRMDDEEYEQMEESGDFSKVAVDPEDSCENFEPEYYDDE